jgi:outer membrane protein OmpA-like peptidoglycan-associated protein
VQSVARKIAALAGATQTAPAEPVTSGTPRRSIFKAKNASPPPATSPEGQPPASAVPAMAVSQAVTPPAAAQQLPAQQQSGQQLPAQQHSAQQTAPAAKRVFGARANTLPASADRIQILVSNGRITLNPTATLAFGSHQEVLEYSSAGALTFQQLMPGATDQGQVVFQVPVTWTFPPAGNRPADAPLVGTGVAHVQVPFSVGPDKDKPDQSAITWQSPRTIEMNSVGGGATLTGAPVTTDPTSNGGAVTITPTVQFQEQLAHATTHGSVTMSHATTATVSAGFLGTGGSMAQTEQVTHDLHAGSQDQTQVTVSDSFSMSFTANVVLAKPVPVPTTASLKVLFAINSDSTAGGEEEKITQWYQGLDKTVRDSIEAGKTRIALLGKASATGSFEHNRKLAERRVEHVKAILADLAGSDAKLHTQATGRSQPHHEGEAADERVVLVTLGEDRPASVVKDEPPTPEPPDQQPEP